MPAKQHKRKPTKSGAPPSHRTPKAHPFPQPSRHREYVLPLHAVGSDDFESVCRNILPIRYPQVTRSDLKQKKGKQQYGVDVEGFDKDQRLPIVVSCKCYEKILPSYLLHWAKEFTEYFDAHWKDKGIEYFVLAITLDESSDKFTEAIKVVKNHLSGFGVNFDVWNCNSITDLLRKDPSLIDRYFNKYWLDAISPAHLKKNDAEVSTNGIGTSLNSTVLELSAHIAMLTKQRNQHISNRVDAARADFRAGRPSTLINCLNELKSDADTWESIDAPIRSRALRTRAMLALNADDSDLAGKLLDEADSLSAAPDRTARAWYLRNTEGVPAALGELNEPLTEREEEIKAALLLEQGDAEPALDLLNKAGVPSTAEKMRLNAIAHCILGKREEAVKLALDARNMDPNAASTRLTLATLHFMAALSNTAALQFGAVPNPFSPGLVRSTEGALAHLDNALNIFNELIPSIETRLKSETEIWKLATLLLHPTRAEQARSYSDELLARSEPEPVSIAWCHFCGYKIKLGQLRKSLEDSIRNGNGTPAHVVMSAILASEQKGPSAGAQTIRQHLESYPEADNFLSSWERRFNGDPADEPFSIAIQKAQSDKEYEPLEKFVSEQVLSANEVLIAAELFADHNAWLNLYAIRERLLPLKTQRAVELAAISALEVNLPNEAVDILDGNSDCFADSILPAGLQHLKAVALDREGKKGSSLRELESAVSRSKDPNLRLQLINRHMAIGDLHGAHRHAREYVNLPSVEPTELVRMAHAIKLIDKTFAKTALERAVSDPKLPTSSAGSAVFLASQLGLPNIEKKMMQVIASVGSDGENTGVTSFSMEELQTFLNRAASQSSQKYDDWIKCRQPTHIAFAHSPALFFRLYLAEPADRLNDLNEPMPMLLRAGRTKFCPESAGESKPILVLDLSGLLLASRLKIVSRLDRCFEVRVPNSLAPSLLTIESEDSTPQTAQISELRELVANRLGADEWTTLPWPADPSVVENIENSPPHSAGLLEVLYACKEGTKEYCWVEDRALSRSNFNKLLSIVEVVDFLKERSAITEEEHINAYTELRKMGYAHLPPRAKIISSHVLAAPISEGALSETNELSVCRKWLADEAGRLKYLDFTQRFDDDGGLVGDPRHALQLMSLARDIIAHIWADEKQSREDRIICTEWVWSIFRLEDATYLPNSTPDARLSLLATTLTHLADLPLVSAFGPAEIPENLHQLFMDWFFLNVLEPRCAAEPKLANSFVNYLSSILSTQCENNGPAEETEASEVQAVLRYNIRKYLDLFPNRWRKAVLAKNNLEHELGLLSTMVIHIDDADITADDLFESINLVLGKESDDSPVIVDLQNKPNQEVVVKAENTDQDVPTIKLLGAGLNCNLPPQIVALALPTKEARVKALHSLPAIVDAPKSDLDKTIDAVCSPPGSSERVVRLNDAETSDLLNRLRTFRERLVSERKTEFSDLDLPPPEVIANYIRWPVSELPLSSLPPGEVYDEILKNNGPLELARRLSAIPFLLPDDITAEIAQDYRNADKKVPLTTALHALYHLRAQSAGEEPSSEDLTYLATASLDYLDDQADLLAAFLYRGSCQLFASEKWRSVSDHVAMSLLWVWADRMTAAFASASVDLTAAVRIVRGSAPKSLDSLLDSSSRPDWFRRHSIDVKAATISGLVCSEILRLVHSDKLSVELRQRALSGFGHFSNDSWFPKLEIAFPPPKGPTSFWINQDPVTSAIDLGSHPVFAPFKERDPKNFALTLLGEDPNPTNTQATLCLLSFVRINQLDDGIVMSIKNRLDELFNDDSIELQEIAKRSLLALKASALARISQQDAFLTELRSMSHAYMTMHPRVLLHEMGDGGSAANENFATLVEISFAYARSTTLPNSDKATILAKSIEVIVEAWPNSLMAAVLLLDNIVKMLPIRDAVGVWPILQNLKGRGLLHQ